MTITPPHDLALFQVGPDELDPVVQVLNEAAQRLHHKGVVQWPRSFADDGGHRLRTLRKRAERGQVFLFSGRKGEVPLGTITLTDKPDPDFAHGWPSGSALYAYRVARADRAAGLGIGAKMLEFANFQAWSAGYPWVRLDCSRTNTALHSYYLNQGFELVNVVEVPGRKSGALFQREAI